MPLFNAHCCWLGFNWHKQISDPIFCPFKMKDGQAKTVSFLSSNNKVYFTNFIGSTFVLLCRRRGAHLIWMFWRAMVPHPGPTLGVLPSYSCATVRDRSEDRWLTLYLFLLSALEQRCQVHVHGMKNVQLTSPTNSLLINSLPANFVIDFWWWIVAPLKTNNQNREIKDRKT